KSNTLASALNIYNGVSSVAALGRQVSSVSSGARQLGKYMAPASRALPAPNQKPAVQTFPLAAKGGATNIRALPSAAGNYTIKKGDTLLAISNRTGVPVAELMKVNGISNPALVRPGTRLSIPATGNLAKGAGVGLSKTKTSTWVFRPSPTTGKIGPDAKLQAEAKKLGIKLVSKTAPVKNVLEGKSNNNWNGSQAEKELAKSQKPLLGEAKKQVVYVNGKETTLTTRPKGSRVIDVQKANWAGDIFESKVGATPYSKVQSQVKADADIITKANGFSSKWSHAAKTTGKILKPVGLVTDSLRVYDAVKADGGSWGQQTNRTLAEVGGGWAGAAGGAALGATAGSVVPVVGTVVGAVVGGIAGAFGGEWLGGQAFGWLNSSSKTSPPKPSTPTLLATPRSAPGSVSWIDSKGLAPVTSAANSLSRSMTPTPGMVASFGR
ncbi:MAG: LysM peptidoglycan-binding domain-containing protein, partial [Gammaproteobacteria bacterium]|nr:LysM peptidoglycan-binding domain-containing protein [Gammaproteobacteria bacterium]MBU1962435.1 LysM peptidoglycan-binding domain-containing protein [Gammaproteobacteria bacterium]